MMQFFRWGGPWFGIVVGILLCVPAASLWTPVYAADLYVTDEVKLTVRSGPGLDRKILKIIESGDRVEMMDEGEEWSLVRLPEGAQGWVLTRYLTDVKPHRLILEELQNQHSSLAAEAGGRMEENQRLKSENQTLSQQVQSLETELTRIRSEHEKLLKSSDANREEIRKIVILLLSGAGILFFGILLGFFSKKSRRKSSLL
ncbi:MAG: TIGR04211 family SH3 domain-containing protein [Desulfobacterales bacterium]